MPWEPIALFEVLDDSMAVYELDGTVVYVNQGTERLFGKTREQLVGRRLWDVFPDAVGNEFYTAFETVSATGEPKTFDHYYESWDRWFRNQIHRMDGRIHVLGNEITEQKLAEQRVQAMALASRAFSRALDLEHLYRELAFSLADTLGDGCCVALIDGDQLRAVAVDHPEPSALVRFREFVSDPITYTEGASGRVFATGKALLIPVVDLEQMRASYLQSEKRARLAALGVHSLIAVPFREGERRIGVITMTRDRTKRAFTPRDLSLVEELADRASMAITHVRLYDDAEKGRRRASAVAAAARAFSVAEREPRRILEVLAEAVLQELGDCVVAAVISADRLRVEPVMAIADFELAKEVRAVLTTQTPLAGSISERVIESRQPLFMPHVDRNNFIARARPEFASLVTRSAPHSFLMVPLECGGQAVGTVSASRVESLVPYTREDLALLIDLAGRASLAIENSRVLEAEREARKEAELVAEQTRQLQIITSELSDRRAVKEIAEVVLRNSVGVIAASTAAIWLVDPTGQRVEMLASEGYIDPARFAMLPIDAPSPIATSIRTGVAIYLRNRAEYFARFPESAKKVADAAPSEFSAATLPLICDGRAIGGLALAFPRGREFREKERAFFEVLANQCAQAIDRTRADEMARAADRRKDECLAMLSHELRSPLAPIMTAIQLMNLRGDTSFTRERTIIERQTRYLGVLVDDLLDLSRVTRGTIELHRLRTDLRAVLSYAIEMATPMFEERNHALALDAPHVPIIVDADEVRLGQCVQNLLANAAKYTPPGGAIDVRLSMSDGKAVVEVVDNGDGIAPELMAVMFEPFVQGTRPADRANGGLGIGLALVKGLVDLHGGSVAVHSDGPAKGSRFTIVLPLA